MVGKPRDDADIDHPAMNHGTVIPTYYPQQCYTVDNTPNRSRGIVPKLFDRGHRVLLSRMRRRSTVRCIVELLVRGMADVVSLMVVQTFVPSLPTLLFVVAEKAAVCERRPRNGLLSTWPFQLMVLRRNPVGLATTLGPLRWAFLTWISKFPTGCLSSPVSHLRPKLALNPERSKKG
jgi:hypothetical protein